MSIAILISTCEKYKYIAQQSTQQLSYFWKYHPDIYVSGLNELKGNFKILRLMDDSRDWISITRNACIELALKGYTKIYLILDDHPPLGKCHSTHLNTNLPEIMDQLRATVICLYGWGQGGGSREPVGEILDKKFYFLEKLPLDYLWKFSLHPGLWDLNALIKILDQLILMLTEVEDRTPWNFERISGLENFPIPGLLKSRAFRVCGKEMTGSKARMYLHMLELFACDTIHYLSRNLLGHNAWEKTYTTLGYMYNYYDGPYPVFWSGILKKGKINSELKKFMTFHRKGTLVAKYLKGYTE